MVMSSFTRTHPRLEQSLLGCVCVWWYFDWDNLFLDSWQHIEQHPLIWMDRDIKIDVGKGLQLPRLFLKMKCIQKHFFYWSFSHSLHSKCWFGMGFMGSISFAFFNLKGWNLLCGTPWPNPALTQNFSPIWPLVRGIWQNMWFLKLKFPTLKKKGKWRGEKNGSCGRNGSQ